jgi:aspartate aminotransferase
MCQYAAAVALNSNDGGAAELETMRKEFEARRDLIVGRLNELPGVKCNKPDGAFYVFPEVSGCYGKTYAGVQVKDSLTFASACLEKAHVALVPGSAFGDDQCVRLSFATSREKINAGIDRIGKLLKG